MGHTIWMIVQLFYRSRLVSNGVFETYEQKVLDYSRKVGIHRNDLRLKPAELGGLLDFKNLERLRDGYIWELKELSHLVFRGQDSTDLFDRYVSDIFHEISILKEEHYNVKTYAPLYERDKDEVELKYILDEAHTLFPQKLRHIKHLFGRALSRLESKLPSFTNYRPFVRSLYLQRSEFVAEAYPDGIRQFYRFMYRLGPVEGFFQVGMNFFASGFLDEALEAFRLAEVESSPDEPERDKTLEDATRLREILREIQTKRCRIAELKDPSGPPFDAAAEQMTQKALGKAGER